MRTGRENPFAGGIENYIGGVRKGCSGEDLGRGGGSERRRQEILAELLLPAMATGRGGPEEGERNWEQVGPNEDSRSGSFFVNGPKYRGHFRPLQLGKQQKLRKAPLD